MKKISKSITINIPSIGMVLFEKSHKAKNIIISIKPPNIIRVAIPKRLSFKKAENFTKANTNWIHGKLNKISKSIKNKIELEAIDLKYAQKPLEERIKYLRLKGIKHNHIIIDPGIGFGKNLKHNMKLIGNISIFHSLGFPILLGISRKRFIKDISGKNDSDKRLGGTVSSSLFAMMQGVQILRVHDVNDIIQGIKVFKKLIKN